MSIRGSIVVSIPACHAGDPGSIPGLGAFVFMDVLVVPRVSDPVDTHHTSWQNATNAHLNPGSSLKP